MAVNALTRQRGRVFTSVSLESLAPITPLIVILLQIIHLAKNKKIIIIIPISKTIKVVNLVEFMDEVYKKCVSSLLPCVRHL